MTLSEKAVAGTVIAILAVIGLSYCNDRSGPSIPDSTATRIDSLEATAPTFDSVVTNQLAEADRRAAVDRRQALRERALQALADSLRARKESLAVEAAAHPDSASVWRAAYVAADSEAAALRTVIDTLRARVDTLITSRDSLRAVALLALERLDVTSGVVVDLRLAIVKATECRWGGPFRIPCPSRKTAFVSGLALAGTAALVGR